ncbi:MAG TPA: ROK family protein [Chloroflexota bacterium]|nr:ROK family protein [Chloroflexota bacterium]
MTDRDAVLALDIGGTKMASAVVARDGTILARGEVPTRGGAEQLYAALVALCQEQLEAAGATVAGIGVGCAGPMRYPDGIVSPINVIAWQEFPLGGRLRETFGLPTFVENDAKVMALGEHWLGGGRSVSNMLGMVVSTGVGGGLILDGRLVHGNAGNAGHVGHVIVWPDGPICPCGARGCLEAVAAGGALALLGGSVAVHAWDLLEPPLQAELGRAARLDFSRQVRVRQAVLGPDAGLLGAAASALSGLGK